MDNRINVLGNGVKANLVNELEKKEIKTLVVGDKSETSDVLVEDLNQDKIKKYEKSLKNVKLPECGTMFSINGQIFKITYVNEGRKRISIEPVV